MTSHLLTRHENLPVQRAEHVPRAERRRWPVRWVAVLLTGCALIALVLAALVNTRDPIFIPTLLLLGAAVLPATITTLVTELGRPGLSLARLTVAAVLGGVAGGVLAGWLEFDTMRALGSLPFLMIGLIEESAKLAVILLLFGLMRPRPRAVDGLVIGVAAGSGFAAVETMGYAFVALLQSQGQLAQVDQLLVVRALVALGGHAVWTGLAGAAWFAMYGARHRLWATLRFLAVFAGVVAMHAEWDASARAGGIGYLLVGLAGVILLAVTTAWLHLRDRATGRLAAATGR